MEIAEELDETVNSEQLLCMEEQSGQWIGEQIVKRCPFVIETCCSWRQQIPWFEEKTILQYANDGFVLAQANCYRTAVHRMDETFIKIVEKASAQGHVPSRKYMVDLLYEDGLLQRGASLACTIQEDEFGYFHHLVEKRRGDNQVHWYDDAERLRELYEFGKNTAVFATSNKAAKAAVLTWCWIAKGWNKDMKKMIGKLVWETRSDPIVWGCETLLPKRSTKVDPFYQCTTPQPKNRLHLIVGQRRHVRTRFLLRLARHFQKMGRNLHKISYMMKQITGEYDVCLIDNMELLDEELDLTMYKCVVAIIEQQAFSVADPTFFGWEILGM